MSAETPSTPTALAQLIALDEAERRHIAHVLHSQVGQSLTAALLSLQFFAEDGLPAEEVESVAESVREALQQVRALSLQLRPPLLDEIGLEAALRSTLEQIADRQGFEFDLRATGHASTLPGWMPISLFRWLQALAELTPTGSTLRVHVHHGAREITATLAASGGLPSRWREESEARAAALGAGVTADEHGLYIRLHG